MRLLPSGDAGLLVECADLDEVAHLYAAVRAHPPEGLLDVVPAARTVLLVVDPGVTTPERIRHAISALRPDEHAGVETDEQRLVEVPVHYDGADLRAVADQWDCSVHDVVRRHTTTRWRVAFCGFAPGFGYLVPDPSGEGGAHGSLGSVRRRATPRTSVPPGSVGLAGEFTGVYPRSSPGGWQLIGRTELPMFDVDREPAALLVPGVHVRFVAER